MDEYDFDDDDFDDQTLAALDQIEKNLLTNKHFSPAPAPPAKRQKTETGWRSATTVANNSFDLDELPEISLCQNTYTFLQTDGLNSPSLTPQPQLSKEIDRRVINRAPVASSSRNISRNNSIQSNAHAIPPKPSAPATRSTILTRPPPVHRNQVNSRASTNRPRNSARLLEYITNALANPTPQPSQQTILQQHATSPPAAACTSTSASQPITVPLPKTKLDGEIIAFQKQLEEMRLENEKMRTALRDAEEARIAKVGEVAVLRRGIHKTAEDHAAQISKLKAAKEEADARQASMQRELKEEMERLKTQFIFKQHELESNSRRPPMSVHARRNIRELPSSTQTPVLGTRVAGPPNMRFVLPESTTPVRAPPSIVRNLQLKSPEKTRQSAMLPGFENSFLESTPKRQSGKGKVTMSPEIHQPLFADVLRSRDVSPPIPAQAPSVVPMDSFGMDVDIPSISSVQEYEQTSSPTRQDDDDNVEMDGEDYEDSDSDSVDELHHNWKAELTRVILTHTHPARSLSTFQTLVEQSTAVSTPKDYSSHMSQILQVIASTSWVETQEDYDRAISIATRCLISMAFALNCSNLISPLVPLLNLLSTLIYSLPSFNSIMLHQSVEHDNSPGVLILLCDIIKQHLTVEKRSDVTLSLAAEALSLAESLCWRTPDDSVDKLDIFVRNLDILTVLLDHLQPCWFLVRATRLLALTSIYPHLARSFLSLPISGPGEDDHPVINPKIPQLDRLCSFLIDTSRTDEESVSLKENVATLLVVLSQAHPDALAALTSSNAIIPSLILYLTHLTSPIWEEDESLTYSFSSLSSTIKALNQTIRLIHYLVFSVEPEIGLKSKLQFASGRPFNGVTHMFIITFGRLSYAPIPDWIETDKEDELSAMRDMARDLLDLVVDGPECDNIYAAYHSEEEDEGKMEEELLGGA